MFGLLIGAFIFSVLVVYASLVLAVLAEVGIRRLLSTRSPRSALWRWLKNPIVFVLVVCALPITLTRPCKVMLLSSMVRRGTHASHAEAAQRDLHVLPTEAEDIDYYADYMGASAEFAISEEDFLKWCADRGWSPKEIGQGNSGSSVQFSRRGKPEPESTMEVRNGLHCDPPRHPRGTGAQIVYDRGSGKAYYEYASW